MSLLILALALLVFISSDGMYGTDTLTHATACKLCIFGAEKFKSIE